MRLSSLHQRTSTMGDGAGCTCLWHGIARGKPPDEWMHYPRCSACQSFNLDKLCWIAALLQEKCTG